MAGLPKMQMERRGGALYPIDPWSEERLYGIAEKTPLDVTATNAKRRGKLGLYWAGLGTLLANMNDTETEQWPTTRSLHNMLMLELGHVERLYRVDGSFRIVPDSIALDAMSDEDFDMVFERVRQFVIAAKDFDPWQEWMDRKEAEDRARKPATRLPPTQRIGPYTGRD